jgi:uncharacterized protein
LTASIPVGYRDGGHFIDPQIEEPPVSNVDKLRQAYQAWHAARGKSTDMWYDLLSDDVTLRSVADGAPEMEFSVARHGKDGVREYFAGLDRDWEMLFYHADEFVADGDRVVMIGRCGWRHKGTGKEVESPIAGYWKFRDGKAVEYFDFYDTARAFAATKEG